MKAVKATYYVMIMILLSSVFQSIQAQLVLNDDYFTTTLVTEVDLTVLLNDEVPHPFPSNWNLSPVFTSPALFTGSFTACWFLNGDSGFKYTPDLGFQGTTIFTYQVEDDLGNIGYADVYIEVIEGNDCTNSSLNIVDIISTNTELNCTCDGTATVIVSGGVPPLDYQWSNGDDEAVADNLCPGIYEVVITDAEGCYVYESIEFTGSTPYNLSMTMPETLEICDGSVSYDAFELIASPELYIASIQWSNGTQGPVVEFNEPGIYTATVTSTTGCESIEYIEVILGITPPVVTASVNYTCDGEAFTVTANEGYASYVWSNGETGSSFTTTLPDIYYVTVFNAEGCSAEGSYTVFDGSSIYSGEEIIMPTCHGSYDGSISVFFALDFNPISYNWTGPNGFAANTATIGNLSAGTYTLTTVNSLGCLNQSELIFTLLDPPAIALSVLNGEIIPSGGTPPYQINGTVVIDANGCIASLECSEGCVYPGDANNDGIANNFDVLNIGLAYGESGIPRIDNNIEWYGHSAESWGISFNDGLDYKYADCDGNGLIENADTIAISQNYGFVHGKDEDINDGPSLTCILDEMTGTQIGDSIIMSVHLGDEENSLADFYGIAFSLEYDATLLKAVSIEVDGDSWLGDPNNTITFRKSLNGIQDVAIVRKDQNSSSGFGKIAKQTFVIIENIDGKNDESNGYSLTFTPSNAKCISLSGEEIEVNPTSLQVESTSTLYSTNLENHVYPNPFENRLYLNIKNISGYNIYRMDGSMIEHKVIANQDVVIIECDRWAYGVYLIGVKSDEGNSFYKIIKSK